MRGVQDFIAKAKGHQSLSLLHLQYTTFLQLLGRGLLAALLPQRLVRVLLLKQGGPHMLFPWQLEWV